MNSITTLSEYYKPRALTVSEIGRVPYSGNITIDALFDTGANWNFLIPERNTLYYTFDIHTATSISTPAPLTAFNVDQMNSVRTILHYAAGITGINFVETTNGNEADFHFATCNLGKNVAGLAQSGSSYSYPNPYNNYDVSVVDYQAEAYIYLDNVQFAYENRVPAKGSAGYETLLHEIGHGLGLKHPFEGPYVLPANQDSTKNTVMSYNAIGAHKTTFQTYDLAALKWIYGGDGLGRKGHYVSNTQPSSSAQKITVQEDHVYTLKMDSFGFKDADAGDTLRAIQITSLPKHGILKFNDAVVKVNQTIDASMLAVGNLKFIPTTNAHGKDYAKFTFKVGDGTAFSKSAYDMTITVSAVRDDLNIKGGEGNDNLYGDSIDANSNDTLSGLSGNDILRGFGGNDILLGGDGNDILCGGGGNDYLNGGNGIDWAYYNTAKSGVVVNLALTHAQKTFGAGVNTLSNIENLLGSRYNDKLIGSAVNNTLKGGDGQDILVGGLGKDAYNLTETVAATDTVRIASGDSPTDNFDQVIRFKLGVSAKSIAGIDKLDLASTRIATNVMHVDGKDVGSIQSHHIVNGLISFDDVDHYSGAMVINKANFNTVVDYLEANIVGVGETVAFNAMGSAYVFQNQGANDTLVQLVGDTVSGLSATGLAAGVVWLV
jgi:hypothetical protein